MEHGPKAPRDISFFIAFHILQQYLDSLHKLFWIVFRFPKISLILIGTYFPIYPALESYLTHTIKNPVTVW